MKKLLWLIVTLLAAIAMLLGYQQLGRWRYRALLRSSTDAVERAEARALAVSFDSSHDACPPVYSDDGPSWEESALTAKVSLFQLEEFSGPGAADLAPLRDRLNQAARLVSSSASLCKSVVSARNAEQQRRRRLKAVEAVERQRVAAARELERQRLARLRAITAPIEGDLEGALTAAAEAIDLFELDSDCVIADDEAYRIWSDAYDVANAKIEELEKLDPDRAAEFRERLIQPMMALARRQRECKSLPPSKRSPT